LRNPDNDTSRLKLSVRSERKPKAAAGGLGTTELGAKHEPERTCILTRRKGSKDQFIRLALGPDGQIAPDVRGRAPGRGAWISVSRSDLEEANTKGKLKGALSRAFKSNGLTVAADLGSRIEAALRQAALDRLGMEARSGNLINGSERVETAARTGKVHLLIHASDAGEDGRRKLDQAWRMGGSRERGYDRGLVFPEPRTILSMALGRENVVHIALIDPAAAARVAQMLARWRAFTDQHAGLDGGETASGPSLRNEPEASADELDEGIE
jgi:predicted RNA-binding protein YlxR (DUF448 family)